MTGSGWKRIVVLLVCVGLSAWWSYGIRGGRDRGIQMVDFGEIYYGARCVMHHQDPYDANAVHREFEADGGEFPVESSVARRTVVTIGVNLPTTLFLAAPFAMLPWNVAENLWMLLIAVLLALAASCALDIGGNAAPVISVCLAGFILANSEVLLSFGNSAGIAVSFCVLAVWCFLKERYVWAGVLLLALSLAIKPHDAGFVWLYFLLAGGVMRKRALQTLAVAGGLGVVAAVWIAQVSPNWVAELHRNIAMVSVKGGTSDPGLSGSTSNLIGRIVNLQAAFSILWNHPRFYNLVSYLISGFLILAWVLTVLKRRAFAGQAQLALAAISVLLLLPVYHRTHDAKLLLLTIPACAMLWAGKGPVRWIALVLTSAGILFTSDIPLALLEILAKKLSVSAATVGGKLTLLFFLRATPVVLLAMGCFYLWIFMRYNPPETGETNLDSGVDRKQMADASPGNYSRA